MRPPTIFIVAQIALWCVAGAFLALAIGLAFASQGGAALLFLGISALVALPSKYDPAIRLKEARLKRRAPSKANPNG